jgi:glycosyltransferase involved in cell wall biosynthesis
MKKARSQLNKDSRVLFISLTDTSYSRSGLLIGNTFKNSDAISLNADRSKYSQIKEIMHQKSKFEAVIVMSPSHLLAIILRRFYKGLIILDAGWPLSDSIEKRERSLVKAIGKTFKIYLVDFFAFKLSNLIYLESFQQVAYCHKKFLISRKKLKVRFTGSLEETHTKAHHDFEESIHTNCNNCKSVIFRGKYNEEAGLELLSKVSASLDSSVHLVVLCPTLPERIKFPQSPNVTVIREFLPDKVLEQIMSQAKLMIGQLGDSSRLNRTIPHKFFESARLGIPYLTPVRKAIQEIASEANIYYVSNKDENLLAHQILAILSDEELLAKKAKNLETLYAKELSNTVLMRNFMKDVTGS